MNLPTRLGYFLEKALASVRESPGVSALTSGTIGAALLVSGVYVMGLQNLESLAMVWGRSAALTAYIADAEPPEQWPHIAARLNQLKGVAGTQVIDPQTALMHFKQQGPQAAELVQGVDPNILPAAIEVRLQSGFADLDATKIVAQKAAKVAGIADVDFGEDEFARLEGLLELLRLAGLGVGILIAIATAFIVANTIRLTVFSRRDEIAILRLVGATHWFIRTPFLFEGALWGAAGALLAVATLATLDALVAPHISVALADVLGGLQVSLIALDMALALVVLGLLLGVLGSALAVRRFLDVETP